MARAEPVEPLAGTHIALLTSSISHFGGGVAEAVLAQARLIAGLGGKASVIALTDQGALPEAAGEAIEIHLQPPLGPRHMAYSPTLAPALDRLDADLLHLHGIWQYPSRAALGWARRSGRPYLISPHGMLDPWITGRGRWKKRLARWGYEQASWRRAAAFHALTQAEAADIQRETGSAAILTIPNPAPPPTARPAGTRAPEIAYLGRIHPKKNLAALIAGWRLAEQAGLPGEARLTIAGWGTAQDVARVANAVAAGPPTITLAGPLHGTEKADLLSRARFLVLPSLSEGLPMALLEAWAAGTPTLMSEACHLPAGFSAGAALHCPLDPAGIAAALCQALRLTEPAWQGMANAALGLATGPFSASRVAQSWASAYAGLTGANRTARA